MYLLTKKDPSVPGEQRTKHLSLHAVRKKKSMHPYHLSHRQFDADSIGHFISALKEDEYPLRHVRQNQNWPFLVDVQFLSTAYPIYACGTYSFF